MTNPWAGSYTSNQYPYVPEYDGFQDVLQETSHHSITSSAPVSAFNHWALEGPRYGYPISTVSCIRQVKNLSTNLCETFAMYPVVDPHSQDDLHTSVGHTTWKSEPEQPWQPNYAESTAWYSPSYAMPSHANPNHDQPQHSAYADGFASPHTPPTTRPVDSVPSWVQRTAIKTKDIANNQESYSQSYSESDDSDDDDSASQKSSTSTTKEYCAAPEVMKLGKWVGNVNNLNITDSQKPLYVCLMKCTRHGQVVQCGQTFGRSEHRRRHCKTVHSKERLYICKVPDCEKSFSRGDNLRDHYWSHVERGGRGGKNKKMGIPALKAILGPKEKELVKRLEKELKIHKEKKEKA